MVPEGVEVKVEGGKISAKGKEGESQIQVHQGVKVTLNENELKFDLAHQDVDKALVGLFYRKAQNVLHGVKEKFIKKLEINGVGFRWNINGTKLQLQIGFSHDVSYDIPPGVEISIKDNVLSVTGVDKQQVGQVAAEIREYRPVEPYKGKGIKYVGEYFVKKQGKSGSTK